MNYLTEFENAAEVIDAYNAPADALDNAEVLLAWYGYDYYEGKSLVIYRRDGKLYEVNGSHCSCYGLEDQWVPEETTWAALAMREFSGYDGADEAQSVLLTLVLSHRRISASHEAA